MASDRLMLTVHIEPSPELREFIASVCREEIAAAVQRAKETRAAGDRPGSNPPPPAGLKPEPPANPPPPRNGALDVLVCSDCGQEKIRTYFTAWGWANSLCMACEKLGSRPQPDPEPDTPEWQEARLLIPGIFEGIRLAVAAIDAVPIVTDERPLVSRGDISPGRAAILERLHLRKKVLLDLRAAAENAVTIRDHQKLHAIKEALAALSAAAE